MQNDNSDVFMKIIVRDNTWISDMSMYLVK